MKICVYCASTDELDPSFYELGEQFGKMLAQRGHSLIFGGYNHGIMSAVARGVASENGEILAVIPKIFDQPDFNYPGCTRIIVTETMHDRKATMEREGDAFAILPGGIGTFDEFFELYVLKSLGQCNKPMGILNFRGCYDALEVLLNQNTLDKLMTRKNREIAKFYTSPENLLYDLENATHINTP